MEHVNDKVALNGIDLNWRSRHEKMERPCGDCRHAGGVPGGHTTDHSATSSVQELDSLEHNRTQNLH